MPIVRTYMCPECSHRTEETLNSDEWDIAPPSCAACDAREMRQEFKPPAIGGSIGGKARRVAEDIMAKDYNVANVKFDNRQGGKPQVRYKDETPASLAGAWAQAHQHNQMLEQAVAIGKQNRRDFGGDGLDILKANLASGAQPDLIEGSKRRAIKVW
jgi:hypothetical protein